MPTTLVIAPRFEALRPFLKKLATDGVPADAVEIYRARNTVYSLSRHGLDLCIKAFHCPSFPNNLIYTHLRQSKARRSYLFSQRLIAMGFDAPLPVAYIENTVDGRLRTSYYVNIMLRDAHNVRHWEQRPDADSLVDDLAAYLARLHAAGVFHKDFTPGNILVTRDSDGRRHFNLIDVNRMQFGIHSHRKLMQNFRAINLDPAQTAALARAYAAHTARDSAQTVRHALRNLSGYNSSKARKKRLKTLLKSKKNL